MLLHATLDLPMPATKAAERLSPLLSAGALDRLSDDAYAAGLRALDGAAADWGPLHVESLEARPIAGGLRVPFRWTATDRAGERIAALDADLDVTSADESCRLSIKASYTPPVDLADASADRLRVRRAAETTLRSLLQALADEALETRAATEHDGQDDVRFFPDAPTAGEIIDE